MPRVCVDRAEQPALVMPTALVIMPSALESLSVVGCMAYAALSVIGLTSEDSPRKNICNLTSLNARAAPLCIF